MEKESDSQLTPGQGLPAPVCSPVASHQGTSILSDENGPRAQGQPFACVECRDTGYVGDNGPGIRGNNEYAECGCARRLKTDDERWRDHFVYPIALEMKRRGIGELRIKLKDNGKADFELLPENTY